MTIITRLSRWEMLGLILLPVALWLLWQLWLVAVVLLLAVIVAIGLEPGVARLEGRGVPRSVAIPGLYAAILASVGMLGYMVGRVLIVQAQSLIATLPELLARWPIAFDANSVLARPNWPEWLARLSPPVVASAGLVVQGTLAGLLVVLIAFYLLLDGRDLWHRGMRLVPGRHRVIVDVLGQEIAGRVRGYLQGVALSSLAIGVLIGAGLAILGVPYALLFGVLAGSLEVIPFLGPLLAAIGPFAFALAQSPTQALIVALFFVSVQQLEEKVLVPRLQSHTTGLHPLTVILATLALGSLFGFAGIILAVPLAVAGQAVIVCLTNCFSHPQGTAAWLAERRPDLGQQRGVEELAPVDAQDVGGRG